MPVALLENVFTLLVVDGKLVRSQVEPSKKSKKRKAAVEANAEVKEHSITASSLFPIGKWLTGDNYVERQMVEMLTCHDRCCFKPYCIMSQEPAAAAEPKKAKKVKGAAEGE